MIIFAFISSVIKMAKEKFLDTDEVETIQEFYPLVMDAPLSNIDIAYIDNLCKTLPYVAEQVIIFLNEKDSGFFKKYSIEYIGREYVLKQKGLLETEVVEVQNV